MADSHEKITPGLTLAFSFSSFAQTAKIKIEWNDTHPLNKKMSGKELPLPIGRLHIMKNTLSLQIRYITP